MEFSFQNSRSLADYMAANQEREFNRQSEEFKRQILMARAQQEATGSVPAAIQVAREIEARLKAGDVEGANLLHQTAKTYAIDRGMNAYGLAGALAQNEAPNAPLDMPPSLPPVFTGTDPMQESRQAIMQRHQSMGVSPAQRADLLPGAIPGYAQAAGGIAATKKGMETQAQKNVELRMNPQIEGAEKEAVLASERGGDLAKKGVKAQDMMGQIQRAREYLPKATGSGLGALRDIGKGIVGRSDEQTQANAALETISGWLVSNVPRMEGPQSDFDVQNYKTMAAKVGNSTVPIGDRLAALDELEGLQTKYADLNIEAQKQPTLYERGKAKFEGAKPKRLKYNPATGDFE